MEHLLTNHQNFNSLVHGAIFSRIFFLYNNRMGRGGSFPQDAAASQFFDFVQTREKSQNQPDMEGSMKQLPTSKWYLVLAALMTATCACSFPLYPQALDAKIETEEHFSIDWSSQALETPAPTADLIPTRPALPPGGLIILETNRDGNREIYSLHADGSNPVNLTNSPDEEWLIECSPDGQWVLYSIMEEGSLKLYLMDIWGKEKTLAFTLPGQEAHGI